MNEQEQQLRIEILKNKLETAKLLHFRAMRTLLPSSIYPVTIRRDGSRWICILQTDQNPLLCPAAYGDTPMEACTQFDSLWTEKGEVLDYDEEEQF